MIDLTQFEGAADGPWWTKNETGNEGQTHRLVVGGEYADQGEADVSIEIHYAMAEDGNAIEPTRRLIAAAPDLLAEVKRLRAAVRDLGAASWRFMYAMGRDVHPAYDALKEMITDLAIDGDVDRDATIDAHRRKESSASGNP